MFRRSPSRLGVLPALIRQDEWRTVAVEQGVPCDINLVAVENVDDLGMDNLLMPTEYPHSSDAFLGARSLTLSLFLFYFISHNTL